MPVADFLVGNQPVLSIRADANILGFHSRGQKLCNFLGTKEIFCMKKEFNHQRVLTVDQHGRLFIVLCTNMAAVT